jgi:hypothetical protein
MYRDLSQCSTVQQLMPLVSVAAPQYIASARTTQKTLLPTFILLLHHVAIARIA